MFDYFDELEIDARRMLRLLFWFVVGVLIAAVALSPWYL